MLNDFRFDADRPMTGLELELNLTDAEGEPAMRNVEVLAELADPSFQTELGQFNLEINLRPRLIAGNGFDDYEEHLRTSLARADERARKAQAQLVMIGILPTLTQRHAVLENLSAEPAVPGAQRADRRGAGRGHRAGHPRRRAAAGAHRLDRAGGRLHQHPVPPPGRARGLRRATGTPRRRSPGVQVAVGANSPYLFGRRLWAETRIALFEQATDTRPDELKAQGVRPRVWFGERWITSIFDLFEENVRYFPPLLPICDDEDPVEVLHAGGVPRLSELRLHNGTIYRWNRPVYDIMNGRPHLRVENRVLPSGPTVVDLLANAAFYFGLVRWLAEADRPIWTQLTFSQAEENFHVAARDGLSATMYWPRLGEVRSDRPRPGAAAALGARRAGPVRGRPVRTGPAARRHRAALPHRAQRGDLADHDRRGAGGAGARPERGTARDAGPVRGALAEQRAGARVAATVAGW